MGLVLLAKIYIHNIYEFSLHNFSIGIDNNLFLSARAQCLINFPKVLTTKDRNYFFAEFFFLSKVVDADNLRGVVWNTFPKTKAKTYF